MPCKKLYISYWNYDFQLKKTTQRWLNLRGEFRGTQKEGTFDSLKRKKKDQEGGKEEKKEEENKIGGQDAKWHL